MQSQSAESLTCVEGRHAFLGVKIHTKEGRGARPGSLVGIMGAVREMMLR